MRTSGQITSNFQFREIDATMHILVKMVIMVKMVVMVIMVAMVIMVTKVTIRAGKSKSLIR